MHATHRFAAWSITMVLACAGAACGSQEQLESTPTEGPAASRAPQGSDEAVSVTVDETDSSDRTVTSDSAAPAGSAATSAGGPVGSAETDSASSATSSRSTGGTRSGTTGGGSTPAVSKAQSITIAPIPGGWAFGDSRTVIAVASSGLQVGLSASGACQVVNPAIGLVQATDVGECRVTASQGGGNGYGAATPVTQTARIGKAVPVIQNFSGRTVEHPRTPFSISLAATASGGATVHYRVLPDGYDQPLCVVSGNALAVSQPEGLPRNCVVEAYVDASSRYDAAVAQATFVINPTVVAFTGVGAVNVGGSSASVTVTLNRVWNIDHSSSCGLTSASPGGDASSYTVTVQYDAFVSDQAERPVSCDLSVSTSQPDGAVTNDSRVLPFDVP